jgi:hydroxymethylbilane synthase
VKPRLRIATRKSPLALWQARHVAELLARRHPELETSLVEMTTAGDRFLQAPLAAIGGKGMFIKEIEGALLEGSADLAVHSLKDVTAQVPRQLCIAALPVRDDPRDAFLSPSGVRLRDLPLGASVGTSSLRRQCQLLERRPDLRIVSLRGNVQTRLRRMREQNLTGVVLAAAGLRRLQLEGEITELLDPEVSLPAVGQGALAIECRADDEEILSLLAPLDDADTRASVTAERSFLSELEGGCRIPLAGYATLSDGTLRVRGLVGSPDGKTVVRGEQTGPSRAAAELGRALAQDIASRGGREILERFGDRTSSVPES